MSKPIRIRKGLNIPLAGEAERILQSAPRAGVYAVCPPDFHGLTPKMLVKEGEAVQAGTPLFYDKYNEDIVFCSPVSGVFSHLIRGEKRRILEVRITPDETDTYVEHAVGPLSDMSREEIVGLLLRSGVWPVIRQRPYAVVARPDLVPKGIFVSCFSTQPVGPDLDFVVNGQEKEFQFGLDVLARLTPGHVHLGVDADHTTARVFTESKGVLVHRFRGSHPIGNVGTQIHLIDPVNKGEVVWHLDVQEVILIGRLFDRGVYDAHKLVALSGPEVIKPRYYRVLNGAQVSSFVQQQIREEEGVTPRLISGSVLSGTRVESSGFTGFYDHQLVVIPEGDKPELLGWLIPRLNKHSISRTFFSFLTPWRKYRLDTNVRSGERPFVVTGLYEKVFPFDIIPMALIKSIMINDIDMMEKLGMYELAPEDFALCEYVCPSKIEMQTIVREGLDALQKEFA